MSRADRPVRVGESRCIRRRRPMRDVGLRARYSTALRSGDAADRAVAAELLRRLDRVADAHGERIATTDRPRMSLWKHVGAADLLAQLGALRVEDRGSRI